MIKHDLLDFVDRIRKRADNVAPAVDTGMRRIALAVNQTLVLATPVDTGRARANWRVSIDREVAGEVGHTSPQVTLNENKATIERYKGPAPIIVQNNVPYIGALNNGSSAQAPAGFVQKAIQTGVAAARRVKVVR